MPWDSEFFEPIVLPRGRRLVTVRDAANYIARLPARERAAAHWQPAALLLRLIGEDHGCVFFARLAVLHGLRCGAGDAPPIAPRRKRARAYKIVPAK